MKLSISTTDKRQVIDVTDRVASELPKGEGVAMVFVRHTTAAVTTADLDPGTDLDLLDFFEGVVPEVWWRHPHNPGHAPDHMLASLVGPSLTVPYANERLLLGTWQRIVLVEFDGPRDRGVIVLFMPSISN